MQHTQRYLHIMMRKSKLPQRSDIYIDFPRLEQCFDVVSRTASLQSNTLFHLGAFMLPFDGGIMNQFTCYMVRDTEFTGEKHDIIYTHELTTHTRHYLHT